MTYAQVVSEVKLLTATEKLDLVEVLLRDLRQTVSPVVREPKPTVEEKLRNVEQLGGCLKPLNGTVPTDNEIREDYTEELIHKYLNTLP
jgi:hypothetical protein